MGLNNMFADLAGEGENSDRIMTRNGARCKFMQKKGSAYTFTFLPALDPTNPDKRTSYLPCLLPGEGGIDKLSEFANYAWVTRGLGRGDFKDRASVVLLKQSKNDDTVCPLSMVYATIRADQTWAYLTDDGKFGDKDRPRAVLPLPQMKFFANVYIKGEEDKGAQVGIFSNSIAKQVIGKNGLVWQRDPKATDEQIAADYMAAYANGDITDPFNAPAFVVEKGNDKGDMSAYEFRYAQDSARRIIHIRASQHVRAPRYGITKKEEYLNILTPEQIVQLLVRELNGRNPVTGHHEYALLREALGSMFQIPEPPPAPGATHTVQSGFQAAPAQAMPIPAQNVPVAQPEPIPLNTQPAHAPIPVSATHQVASEAGQALKAAIADGAAAPAAAPHVTGDPVPKFDRAAFLARMAAKGGNQ